MRNFLLAAILGLGLCLGAAAQPPAPGNVPAPVLGDYFTSVTAAPSLPDAYGFVRRWSLLDPIAKPELTSNRGFNDTFVRSHFEKEYFKDQMTMVPKDGQTVTLADKTKLKWHWLESKTYDVYLYRFAGGLGLQRTAAMYMMATVINVEKDVTVRMSVGSNAASLWWMNGEEAVLLPGDRHMMIDDYLSKKITLKAGKNVLRGMIINGPGWSDFCIRFYDLDGKVFKDFTITNQ